MFHMRMWLLVALVLTLFGKVFLEPSFAQTRDLKPILDRLQRIERDIKTLNIQVSREGDVSSEITGSSAAARVAVRLIDLEDELRATTGRVETVSQQIVEIGLRLDKLITDLDYRLSTLENGVTGAKQTIKASPSPGSVQQELPGTNKPGVLGTITKTKKANIVVENDEQQSASAQSMDIEQTSETSAKKNKPLNLEILPKGTPAERYSFAVTLLRKGDYEQAEIAFNEFLSAHPGDELIDNARYWLAESYYVRGRYVQAAEYFISGYQANASAAKAPDMLLKLGMSLSKLDKNKDACASFAKLLDDFPKASSRILKKVTLESKKIGCK